MKISVSIDGIGYVSSIEVGADDSQLIVTFSNYGVTSVYETQDMGESWLSKEGDLPDMPVRWSLYNPSDRTQVMLATEVGVWVTNNFDEPFPNWMPANTGLANVRSDMLYYRESDDLVAIATFGRGLFTSDIFRAPEDENQPFGLIAENKSKSRVDLIWEDNSIVETGFIIQRSLLPEEGYTTIGTVGPDINSYNDLTVNEQTTYYYRVAAQLEIGQSGFSNTASTTTDDCVSEIPTGGTWTASPPSTLGAPSNSPVYINQISDDTYEVSDVSGGVYNSFWGFNLNQPAEFRLECGEIYVQNALESGSQFYIVPDSVPGVYDDSTQTITLPWFDGGNGFSLLTNFTRNGDGEPELSPAGITFSNVTDVSLDINMSAGNGSGRLVIIREGQAIDPTFEPADGVAYFSSSEFGAGDQIGDAYVIGDSDNTSFSVANLKPGTLYHVGVYEYNEFNGAKDYLTSSFGTNSHMTEVYIVLNEFLATPATDLASGDANGDGVVDTNQDEFIEVVNVSGKGLDISNWIIADGISVRHVIPENTILDSAAALVVFGGGNPDGVFGNSTVHTASTGSLSLDDSGDQITMIDPAGGMHISHLYGEEANTGQSLTRDPDLTGAFLPHQFASGPEGGKFSPGTRSDGTWFIPAPCSEITAGPSNLLITPSAGCNMDNGSIQVLSVVEDGEQRGFTDYSFEWMDTDLNPITLGGSNVGGLAPGDYLLQITNITTKCSSELIAVTVGFDAQIEALAPEIAEVSSTSAVISWSEVETEGYSVWYRAGVRLDWTHMDNVTSPLVLSDLASGTAYDVRVYPMCGGEISSDASFVEFVTNGPTTCDAPVATVDHVAEDQAEISWTGDGSQYNVWYRSGKGSNWTKRDIVVSPYTMQNLAAGTTYEVRVYSVCEGVASFPTVMDFTTPGERVCSMPEVEILDVTDSTASISWIANNDGYNVWYRGGTGSLWTKLYDVAAPIALDGLASGTFYEARVYGVCDSIVGTPTEVNFITMGPVTCETPQVSVTDIATNTAQVSWLGNSDYYNVWYRTGAGAPWTKLLDKLYAPIYLTDLSESTAYEVRVYGYCGNIASLAGSTGFTTEGLEGCNIPNITISDLTDNSAAISWSGNGDKYNLWYRAGRGARWTKFWGISGPEEILKDLAPGTTYQLRVYSVCGDVVSDFSERYFETTGQPSCPAPIVVLDSLNEKTAYVSWSGDADKAVLYYKVRGQKWRKIKSASQPFVIDNLIGGVTYDVQVWNVCGNVTSEVGAMSFDTPYTNTIISHNPDGSMRLPWVQTFAQSSLIPGNVAAAMIEEVDESLEIFPNPAPGIFQLSANNVDLSLLSIRLYSLAGQEIPVVARETSFRTFELRTSAENGIYMLKISGGETEVVRKIVIKY
ncbi:MAG: fibronectin type III domain-containing protein [Bacteroidota bacterium]